MTQVLAPASPSPGFRGFFAWYARRLMRKRFNAVRVARGSLAVLAEADRHDGPLIALMNHASWWDPLVGLVIADRFFAQREPSGVIALEQWRTFGFMRRLGVFGLDPDHPGAMEAMVGHVRSLFARSPRSVFMLTPQGEFTDVRTPVRLRPGAPAIAAGEARAGVVCLAIEYAFWTDQRPEVFIRAARCDPPRPASTTAWHRAMTRAMRENGDALRDLVIARDPGAFEALLAPGGPRVNAAYDALVRARGRDPRVAARATGGRAAGGRA